MEKEQLGFGLDLVNFKICGGEEAVYVGLLSAVRICLFPQQIFTGKRHLPSVTPLKLICSF